MIAQLAVRARSVARTLAGLADLRRARCRGRRRRFVRAHGRRFRCGPPAARSLVARRRCCSCSPSTSGTSRSGPSTPGRSGRRRRTRCCDERPRRRAGSAPRPSERRLSVAAAGGRGGDLPLHRVTRRACSTSRSWLALVAFCGATVEVVSRLGGRRSVLFAAAADSLVFAPSVADQLAGPRPTSRSPRCSRARACRAAVWLEERRGWNARARRSSRGRRRRDQDRGDGVHGRALRAAGRPRARRRAGDGALAAGLAGIAALAVGILPWRIWLCAHHVPEQVTVHRLTSPSLLGGHVLAFRMPPPISPGSCSTRARGSCSCRSRSACSWSARRSWTPLVFVRSRRRLGSRSRGSSRLLDDPAAVPLPPRHLGDGA